MTNTVINISVPPDLLRQIDELAAADQRTRSELLNDAARRYMSDQRWRRIQAIGAERARAAGLHTEDDIEEFMDSLPDDRG